MFVLQLITLDLFKRNILQHLIHKHFFFIKSFFFKHILRLILPSQFLSSVGVRTAHFALASRICRSSR